MTNVLLAGFTSRWHRRKSSMRTTGEEPTSATRHDTTRRDCPQRPEPLERNARTILLDSKGAENQQKFSRGRDRTSTRLNSSHQILLSVVFSLIYSRAHQ